MRDRISQTRPPEFHLESSLNRAVSRLIKTDNRGSIVSSTRRCAKTHEFQLIDARGTAGGGGTVISMRRVVHIQYLRFDREVVGVNTSYGPQATSLASPLSAHISVNSVVHDDRNTITLSVRRFYDPGEYVPRRDRFNPYNSPLRASILYRE